nr:sodium:solute symporter [bacterium]
MTILDWIVLAIFLITCLGIGLWAGRGQKDSADYFLGKRNLPWWAVSFSVVATETSVLTFIGIPAIAYATNLQFLQLTIGYVLGRYLVARFLIPAYFSGNISTTYEFLGQRFDANLRRLSSLVFVVTRILADGVRLFATAIPLKLMTGISYPDAILLIGIITIIYTLAGGIRSVVWMDVMQLGIYIGGAVIALVILIPDSVGFAELLETDKLQIFAFSGGGYTLVLSVLGGMFLSMASHGTDHLMVQRLLACKSEKESKKALVVSGWIVMAQFALFLVIGAFLWLKFYDLF